MVVMEAATVAEARAVARARTRATAVRAVGARAEARAAARVARVRAGRHSALCLLSTGRRARGRTALPLRICTSVDSYWYVDSM